MAAVPILTSLFGRKIGLDNNGDLIVAGVRVTNVGASGLANQGASNGATVVATEYGNGIQNYTVLTCTATPISVADDAGQAQYGGVKVYDFPAGLIILSGAIVSGVMGVTSGTIITTWAGVVALGTAVAAATGAPTLVTTSAAWMQSNAIAAATASVATIDAVTASTQVTEAPSRDEDGTATAVDMYLNVKVADDASHTAAVLYFTGTIKFAWTLMGDN